MYTVKIINKSVDKLQRQFVLDVQFTDGTDTISEQLRYSADFSFEDIQKNLKQRLNALNNAITKESDIVIGDVDTASVPDDTPTQAELDAQTWLRNFERLQKVQILIDLQVLTGNETPVQNLRSKVSTDFKPAYINLF